MATVILVRHGRSTANTDGVLAGHTPGVGLDKTGRAQAAAVAERLAAVPLARVVSSPLQRTRQTAAAIAAPHGVAVRVERGLAEAEYGAWTGRPLKELAREKLWKQVVAQPSAVTFPDGESMRAMAARVVEAVRRHDAEVTAENGDGAVWAAVSHGDLIKAVLADALGLHLDQFQRLHVDPGSVSIVRYTQERPYVLQTNTHAGDLGWLKPPKGRRRRSGARRTQPQVGGGAGPEQAPE